MVNTGHLAIIMRCLQICHEVIVIGGALFCRSQMATARPPAKSKAHRCSRRRGNERGVGGHLAYRGKAANSDAEHAKILEERLYFMQALVVKNCGRLPFKGCGIRIFGYPDVASKGQGGRGLIFEEREHGVVTARPPLRKA
jgi:hypothetical protein